MSTLNRLSIFIGMVAFSILVTACDDSTSSEKVNYDRAAFLTNLADNLIVPSFADFNTKVIALSVAIDDFTAAPDQANLVQAQAALKTAWLSYQYVAYMEVGPSADLFFREEVNIFPTDAEAIDLKIANADYTFTGGANIDVKGFPAIDYLLNGSGVNADETIAFYTDATLGDLRSEYLKKVSAELKRIANSINEAWPAYRTTFIENEGTDIGSSTGILVNEFNKQYDLRLKNGKIGIPSGVKSFERTNPNKVECLHGQYSKELAVASADAAINIFNGVAFGDGEDGEGYDDYLDALGAEVDGVKLSVAINEALLKAAELVGSIEGNIEAEAETYEPEGDLVKAYNALQAVIPLIKVDMTSAMSVTIAFQDNDGD